MQRWVLRMCCRVGNPASPSDSRGSEGAQVRGQVQARCCASLDAVYRSGLRRSKRSPLPPRVGWAEMVPEKSSMGEICVAMPSLGGQFEDVELTVQFPRGSVSLGIELLWLREPKSPMPRSAPPAGLHARQMPRTRTPSQPASPTAVTSDARRIHSEHLPLHRTLQNNVHLPSILLGDLSCASPRCTATAPSER